MSNIHPLLVHFPVALLTVSFLFDVAGVLLNRVELNRTGWWMLVTGFAGVLFAVASGLFEESGLALEGVPLSVLETHKQTAFAMVVCYAVVLLWRVAGKSLLPVRKRGIFWLLYGCGVMLLWVVAWYGGELVHTHGVPFAFP
ncbi:MAG: DUF2231 domain-containing protein [Ignavibacteria bacterium]|nr:DUF2231 domain-containing protein [Ignavibacteria bacterium]